MAIRIGINGFGRIGRLVYRIASEDPNFEIAGVNDLVPADNLAYLLAHDTMHGRFRLNGELAQVSASETITHFSRRRAALYTSSSIGMDTSTTQSIDPEGRSLRPPQDRAKRSPASRPGFRQSGAGCMSRRRAVLRAAEAELCLKGPYTSEPELERASGATVR